MQQRYYDPQIGRFLSNDPVGTDPKTGGNFSRFRYANNSPFKFTDPDGRYACRGTTSECDQIADALAAVRAAANTRGISSRTRSTLNGILRFYGARGQRNGVIVSSAGGAPNSLASTIAGQTSTGRIWAAVSFHSANMSTQTAGRSPSEVTDIFATVLVHEAGHGMDRENNFGNSYYRSERVASEVKGYTNEAHYALGSGYDFGGFTMPGGKIDYSKIQKQAESDIDTLCKTGWSCL